MAMISFDAKRRSTSEGVPSTWIVSGYRSLSKEAETASLVLDARLEIVRVKQVQIIAYSIIIANVVNLFFVRLGIITDVLLLATSIPALFWALSRGIDTRRIGLYLFVAAAFFVFYLLYSAFLLSYNGFRNVAALIVVISTFLFFFRAASYLCANTGFLISLFIPLGSFVLLWENPYAVGKNFINAAMCYYLVAIFLCYPGMLRLKSRHVTILFFLIFAVSAANGHRTLAASSVFLLFQYYILSMDIARQQLRFMMFVGMTAAVAGVIAVLTNPDMAVVTAVLNDIVTGEGGRSLNSGRQILWPVVWQAIVDHPILGLGPGTVVSDIYATPLSAHNLYLQIGLQVGYVGFGLLLLLFWSLWHAARPTGSPVTRLVENLMSVVVTMVVMHSLFDVFLLQNALAVGVPVWMVLGLGLGMLSSEAAKIDSMRGAQKIGPPIRVAKFD